MARREIIALRIAMAMRGVAVGRRLQSTVVQGAYYFSVVLDCSYEEAVNKAKDALKEQGFGILTEIDLKATMKKKLDAELLPHVILGACNPQIAYKALGLDNHVSALLPCNVTVQQLESGEIDVSFLDPMGMPLKAPGINEIMQEAKSRLQAAAETLAK